MWLRKETNPISHTVHLIVYFWLMMHLNNHKESYFVIKI